MSDRRTRRVPASKRVPFAVAAGLIGLAGLAGCTGSGGSSSSSGAAGATDGAAKPGGPFSAGQLKKALLIRINGVGPASAPDAGSYASLPAIKTAAAQMLGTTITPAECAQATVLQAADLDTGALDGAPAAVANFQVGADGVSEVLAAHPGSAAVATLAETVPAGCAHYTVTAGGKTVKYAVKQDLVHGIGMQPARIVNISAPKQKSNVWSVLYRGDGFVGAITVDGPNASEAVARALSQQAYAYAAQSLS
ncbi:MAG: hypothetical protein JWM19_7562 [Actinomycetia bacterium]|nr:hypothetical protein [Actinomycetes bacterium]